MREKYTWNDFELRPRKQFRFLIMTEEGLIYKESQLLTKIQELESKRDAELHMIAEKYNKQIDELVKQCNHCWDDGSSAIREHRAGYASYMSVCQVCGKVIDMITGEGK